MISTVSLFFSGFLLSLSLCLDLGIVNISMIRFGLERGFWPAFFIGLGSSFGATYLCIIISGRDFVFIKIYDCEMGSLVRRNYCFIILNGLNVASIIPGKRNKKTKAEIKNQASIYKDFGEGIGLALSSPSAILWFATVGGSIIASSKTNSRITILCFFSGFFIASCLWSWAVSCISNRGGKLLGPKIVQIFSFISAILFTYFAAKVFINGYRDLFFKKIPIN